MYIFDIILNSLPMNMLNDDIFILLKNNLIEFLKNHEIDFDNRFTKIKISESAFTLIDFPLLESDMGVKNKLEILRDPKGLCYALLAKDDYSIDIRISGNEDNYRVILGIYTNNGNNAFEYRYEVHGNKGLLEERKTVQDGFNYLDYSYDVKKTSSGKIVGIGSEKEKDLEFKNKFGVPDNLVRQYRKNFTKYTEDINKYFAIANSSFADDMSEKKWNFERFKGLDEFVRHIKECNMDDNRNEEIISLFKSQSILTSAPFAISLNTLDSMEFYLMKIANALKTRGIIIKKENEDYSAFYVIIQEGTIVFSPTNISSKKAKEMYDSGFDYQSFDNISTDDLLNYLGL